MRIISLLYISLLVIGAAALASAQGVNPANKEVKVTYVANAGFLVQIDNKKILVDGLFKNERSEYYDSPSDDMITNMVGGRGVFQGISLLATSHEHIDNFDAKLTTTFLENNPTAKLIGCSSSVDLLKKESDYDKVKGQVVDLTPERLTFQDTLINGVEVRVLGLGHGPYFIEDPLTGRKTNIYKYAKHVGFLFKVDGVTIFHCGDSNSNAIDEYQFFHLDQYNIDIAFLGRGFLYQPKGQGVEIMRKYIQAKNYVIMQIQHEDNQYYIDIANIVKDEFPNVKIFTKELESKEYYINSNLLSSKSSATTGF